MRHRKQKRRRIRRQQLATGRRPSHEEVAADIDALWPGKVPAAHTYDNWGVGDWTEDLRCLREAGCQDVDCFRKELRICLTGGYRYLSEVELCNRKPRMTY